MRRSQSYADAVATRRLCGDGAALSGSNDNAFTATPKPFRLALHTFSLGGWWCILRDISFLKS
ncbi:hypothetical protein [Hydrogenimonas urashimensis]|uniref:hypothetical protein n=1 Tax=Hydrogenimonas urashimensis TaxID=2740515 RepID=UPI0019151AA3|nr:hypothetical protein [Hydrogenimonas urashimensis]